MEMSKIKILINTDLNTLKTQQQTNTPFIKTYEQTLNLTAMKHISKENSNDTIYFTYLYKSLTNFTALIRMMLQR
jgi:hypothetical protein